VPFDPVEHIIPNDRGRVLDHDGHPVPGVYVTGWIKRGPRSVISTDRTAARSPTTVRISNARYRRTKRQRARDPDPLAARGSPGTLGCSG
jgi:NADPH-dependent glutamate synthase beta subunit-like oxidoreductase